MERQLTAKTGRAGVCLDIIGETNVPNIHDWLENLVRKEDSVTQSVFGLYYLQQLV